MKVSRFKPHIPDPLTAFRLELQGCPQCAFRLDSFLDRTRILTAYVFDEITWADSIGWIDQYGVESVGNLGPRLIESLRAYTWVDSVDPIRHVGLGAALPVALAYKDGPRIVDMMWEAGRLVDTQEALADDSLLALHLIATGLDQEAPPSPFVKRSDSVALYSPNRGIALFIGGNTVDGPAKDILTYHLLERAWTSTRLDGVDLNHVVTATFDSRRMALWILDRADTGATRLIFAELSGVSSEVLSAKGGFESFLGMSVDRDGDLLLACGAYNSVFQIRENKGQAEVISGWPLNSPPIKRPLVDSFGARVLTKGMEIDTPFEFIELKATEGSNKYSLGDVIKWCLP